MQIKFAERPFPAQLPFFKAKTRYIAYGGARGGGKSWAVRLKASLLCCKYAGIRVLIVRRSYAELKENHILPLQSTLRGLATYNDNDKAFKFVNGSRLKFGYCANESDVTQYQGVEYDVIFIDEATQLTEFQFTTINATIRGTNEFPKRMYLTCNPGGVGHQWVKRLFIDKEFLPTENPDDYTFIKALVFDNEALMASNSEYVKTLEALPEGLRQAWLFGDWDIFEGRFFPEFRRETHVVEAFEIPDEWRRYRVFDYGLDCFACYWVAVDFQNNAYFYRELCESNLLVSEAAKKMIAWSEGEDIRNTFAPPDMWNRHRETGKSTFDIFHEYGVDLSIASNDRKAGWLNVKEALKVFDDEQGYPTAKVKVFSNCKKLIKSLSEIQTDEKDPNDVANTPHELTHSVDAMRYFFAANAKATKKPNAEVHYNFESEKPKVNPIGKGIQIKVV